MASRPIGRLIEREQAQIRKRREFLALVFLGLFASYAARSAGPSVTSSAIPAIPALKISAIPAPPAIFFRS
jgi:hypothetical protein